ncbi:FAD-dependent oxidoreductase [Candidatus Pelagibacter sp.]|nr:FAD-dependent oxidoreductase [Candidatus Pelagibacter sp.]
MIYNYVIIGGGIAGISIAEILSRTSDKVCLLEKEKLLMSKSSSDQHGWFHIGSLYAFMNNEEYLKGLIKNTKDIINYYSEFKRLNMKLNSRGSLEFNNSEDGWFRNSDVNYLIASRNNQDLNTKNFFRKIINILSWEKKIKKFVSRHNKLRNFDLRKDESHKEISKSNFINYSKKEILKPSYSEINIDNNQFFSMTGFDKPMRSKTIYSDLYSSFKLNGGATLLETDFKSISEKHDFCEISFNNKNTIKTKKIIFANGAGIKNFIKDVNIFESPLMVTYPNILNKNIVKLTPNNDNTINHFMHEHAEGFYSVIGSGLSSKLGDDENKKNVLKIFQNNCKAFFKNIDKVKFKEIYFGKKVEYSTKDRRNYHYKIFDLSNKQFAVLPGKFSMAFSLAVNVYKKFNNTNPPKTINKNLNLDNKNISENKHYNLVSKFISNIQT